MPDLYDYVRWRGDLPFQASAFNRVDALILSSLVYANLDGEIPPKGITLTEAARNHFQKTDGPEEERKMDVFEKSDLLWARLADTRRFGRLILRNFVNDIDPQKEQQFCAVTIDLGHYGIFVAYRGTDNTLVGWKENFNMAYCLQVGSQQMAVEYLNRAAAASKGSIRVGGHSKGGNLAVYAASSVSAKVQRRIRMIYNYDGPGFREGALDLAGYEAVRERIRSFVPQTSVVGMLLDHEDVYTVVHSSEFGLRQHDPYTWQLDGPDFECMDQVDEVSRFTASTLGKWVASQDHEHREQFVDALFQVLSAAGEDFYPVPDGSMEWFRDALAVLARLTQVDRETRRIIMRMLWLLLRTAHQNLPEFLEDLRDRRSEE